MANINGNEIYFGVVGQVGDGNALPINNNGKIVFGKASIIRAGLAINDVQYVDGNYNDVAINQTNMYLNEAHLRDDERGVKMRLGVGTTPPAPEDIWLADTEVDGVDINTYITCTNASVQATAGGGVEYSFTFINGGSSAVTINEICICMSPVRTNAPRNAGIMLGRKVILPTTINAGGTQTFTYEINV